MRVDENIGILPKLFEDVVFVVLLVSVGLVVLQ